MKVIALIATILLALVATSASAANARREAGELANKDSGLVCEGCQFIIGYIEGTLNVNATEEEVEYVLTYVCDLLPGSVAGLCESIIDNYVNELVQYLLSDQDPTEICEELYLCNYSTAVAEISKRRAAAAASVAEITKRGEREFDICSACEFVVESAQKYIEANGTIDEVVYYADQLCDILPSPYNAICSNFVEVELPELIDQIVESETPEEICADIDVCYDSYSYYSADEKKADHKKVIMNKRK